MEANLKSAEVPLRGYYTSKYSGEEIDALLGHASRVSNPNLLINGYFPDPINQRGQTEYTTDGYTIDRWFLFNCPSAKLLESGIQIKAKPDGSQIVQRLPLGCIKENTLLTLSILDTDGELVTCTGRAALSVDSGFFVIASWGWIAFRNTQSTPFWEAVYNTNVDKVFIAAKLELGPIQTLARQDADGNWVLNDPPPNKALELVKCQQYARNIKAITGGARYGQGHAITSTQAFIIVELGVGLRITPSVIKRGALWLISAGSPVAVTSISVGAYADGIVTLTCNTDGGLTPGSVYGLMDNNTGTSSIFFDANL